MSKYNACQRACLIILVLFCVTTTVVVYHCASSALDAEETYGDLVDVLTIATVYLQNNPEWPKGWEDLEQAKVPLHSHTNGLPASHREFEDWKKRVYVDFSLTRAEVAAATPENFTAIRPIVPCWPPEERIKSLLESARQDDGCAVLEALTIYLRNNAEWPKSWTHLKDLHLPIKSGSGFYLGSDCIDQWKKRVVVDFRTTRALVAAMTVENFDAVKPVRAIYGPRDQRIKELLEAARQQPETPERP